jgi:23S rRNA (guanosine2251-2'-O)-methyltransferase
MRNKNKGPRTPGPRRPQGGAAGGAAGGAPRGNPTGRPRPGRDAARPRPPGRDERRDRPSQPAGDPRQRPVAPPADSAPPRRGPKGEGADYWLYGRHAVEAALANPARNLRRLLLAETPDEALARKLATLRLPLGPEVVGRAALEGTLPPGAVHQGLALRAEPLFQPSLPVLLAELRDRPAVILALDHVTDPQNVGAILRSAAAFGAAAVLATVDHAPPEGGALAKTASGGLEVVPYLRETNLARALELLKQAGFWCFGLAEQGEGLLEAAEAGARSCLVLGAEGEGLRRLTRERCDRLVRLPTRPPIAALNVSNAAAVALYELLGRERA